VAQLFSLGIMRKSPLAFWLSVLFIIIGVAQYLVDCQRQCQSHPHIAWIQSGIYDGWGLLIAIGFVALGSYRLGRLCK
jgi:hypothetical protein